MAGTADDCRAGFECSFLDHQGCDDADFLVSAGFDAHRADPLSGTQVSEDGYATITARLTQFADESCQGRMVSLLEGGYDLNALASSAETHIGGLLGTR